MGHLVAFGATEESLLVTILGCKGHGRPEDGAFSHATGAGYVKPCAGHYRDALVVKHNTVIALIADPLGGVTHATFKQLLRWASDAADGRDATVYGLYETPGAFFAHHAAALSMAVVRREAAAIEAGTEKREFRRMHPGLFMAGPAHL